MLYRTYCPKADTQSVLLSDKEQDMWEQSRAISDQDKELVDAILSRYGFTEVNSLFYQTSLQLTNIELLFFSFSRNIQYPMQLFNDTVFVFIKTNSSLLCMIQADHL